MSEREALLDDARRAYGRNDWAGARSALVELDAVETLGVDDLERLAWAHRWTGDEAGFLNLLERAEVAFVADGRKTGAARMAGLGGSARADDDIWPRWDRAARVATRIWAALSGRWRASHGPPRRIGPAAAAS